MSPSPADWPPVLGDTLRRWIRRRRRQAALRILAAAITVAGLAMTAAMAIDLSGDPLPWLRIGLAGGGLIVVALGLVLAARRLAASWTYTTAAREVEAAAGLSGEPLSGPLFLSLHPGPGHSHWMVGRSLALAAVAADAIDLRRLLPWRPTAPAQLLAMGTIAFLVVAGFAEPAAHAAAVRALLPWRELPAPGDELLLAEPGDTWLAPGEALTIAVHDQPVPLTADLAWTDGRSESRPLVRDGADQRLEVGPLHRELRWRVRGPGLASSWRTASQVAVPTLTALAMLVSPPGYAGLPDERIQGGDATVLTGSDTTIDVVLEGPSAATAVIVTEGGEVPLPLARSPYGGQFGSAKLHVTANLDWHLRLIVAGGPGGVAVDLPQRWRLQTSQDTPPEVTSTVDAAVVATGRAVRFSVSAADDVALASVWLELAGVGASEPVRLALPVPTGTRRMEATAVVVPADLGAQPGDRLDAVPVARDRAGNETRGAAVRIAVSLPVHAARHDLSARLVELIALTHGATAAAGESDKAWRAAVRAWRVEDPAAGAAGLRAAAARVRDLSTAATAVADGAGAAAVLANAPGNLDALATRALAVAGGALALAARSTSAERGSAEAVAGAVEAAAALVQGASALAESANLAAAAAATAAAAADLQSARDLLTGSAAVLAAERAWTTAVWRPGLLGSFWRGTEPGVGEAVRSSAEVPAVTDRDVPGLGRDGWCARWTGEVLLPQAGRWTFRCTADDGVRLRVAGADLLPATSWKEQGATAYLGSVELPAGWHPIEVDYYQGTGGSRLLVEAGVGEPAPLTIDRLRHRLPPDASARQAMTALPVGAGEAAALRARHASELAASAGAALIAATKLLPSGHVSDSSGRRARQAVEALKPLAEVLDWSDGRAVDGAADAVVGAVGITDEIVRQLREVCRGDGRRAGGDGGFDDHLREAAAKPGSPIAAKACGELATQRAALAAISADTLLDPARRAAALAAAWAIDAMRTALAGDDSNAARAAVAAAVPPLALAARHARAAEAADGAANQGGALLAELALSPGWPPGLLRPARDLLRQAAADLRAGEDPEPAGHIAAEAARAAELETLRPGAPPSPSLAAAAAWLRDLAVLPQADALAEVADLFEQADRSAPQTMPEQQVLSAAAKARRTAAADSLADSAASLAAAVPALAEAGLPDLAARAGSLAELARAIAASPDQAIAHNLAETLSGTLAGPLADAVASGRLEPGCPAALAGRLAARTAAAAAAVAALPVPTATGDEAEAGWSRSHDPAAVDAASAAAAVEFPEEYRAAIRAYLRRIGAPR